MSNTPDHLIRVAALEEDAHELDTRVTKLESNAQAMEGRVGILEADRLVTATQMRKTEDRITEQLDDFRKEWRDQRKWTRQQVEKFLTEMCSVTARVVNLGEMLITRMTPYPLTGLLLVAMLIGSGMAWKLAVPEWFDISAGEQRAADHAENDEREESKPGTSTAPPLGEDPGL